LEVIVLTATFSAAGHVVWAIKFKFKATSNKSKKFRQNNAGIRTDSFGKIFIKIDFKGDD
jgi:hypothetical protein